MRIYDEHLDDAPSGSPRRDDRPRRAHDRYRLAKRAARRLLVRVKAATQRRPAGPPGRVTTRVTATATPR